MPRPQVASELKLDLLSIGAWIDDARLEEARHVNAESQSRNKNGQWAFTPAPAFEDETFNRATKQGLEENAAAAKHRRAQLQNSKLVAKAKALVESDGLFGLCLSE